MWFCVKYLIFTWQQDGIVDEAEADFRKWKIRVFDTLGERYLVVAIITSKGGRFIIMDR